MAEFITVDKEGVVGPVLTLLKGYGSLNSTGLHQIVAIIRKNREKLANNHPIEIVGGKELVDLLSCSSTPIETILQSGFFQSMLSTEFKEDLHKILKGSVVSPILEAHEMDNVSKEDQERIIDWLARLLQSYLIEEQIVKLGQNKDDPNSEKIMEFRQQIGKSFYSDCSSGKISKRDVESMVKVWFDMDQFQNDKQTILFIAQLFHNVAKMEDIIRSLKDYDLSHGEWMEKMFSNNSNSKSLYKHIGNYLELFSMAEDPKSLAEQVGSLIKTNFIPKIYE